MATVNNTNEKHNKKASKRKRVNRMKTLIVFAAVFLLFSSVILNFVLIMKVLKLENKINQIYSQNHIVMIEKQLYI